MSCFDNHRKNYFCFCRHPNIDIKCYMSQCTQRSIQQTSIYTKYNTMQQQNIIYCKRNIKYSVVIFRFALYYQYKTMYQSFKMRKPFVSVLYSSQKLYSIPTYMQNGLYTFTFTIYVISFQISYRYVNQIYTYCILKIRYVRREIINK